MKIKNQSEVVIYKGFKIDITPYDPHSGYEWEVRITDILTGMCWSGCDTEGKKNAIAEGKATADCVLEEYPDRNWKNTA